MENLKFIQTLFKTRKEPKQGQYESLYNKQEQESFKNQQSINLSALDEQSKPPTKMESLSSMPEPVKEGFFNVIKSSVAKGAESVKEKVEGTLNTGRNWTYFALFAVAGGIFFFLAFTMLPMLLISPGKFTMSFTLGSLCIMAALAFLRNPLTYIKSLFEKDRIVISLVYLSSLVLALYASLISCSYFMTIVALGVEFFSLMWFVLGDVPGGKDGVITMGKFALSGVKNIGGGIFNKGKSMLPV